MDVVLESFSRKRESVLMLWRRKRELDQAREI